MNFFNGTRYDMAEGGWLLDQEVPLDEMPVSVRPGTEIPIYFDEVDCTDQMDLDKAEMLVVDDDFNPKNWNLL